MPAYPALAGGLAIWPVINMVGDSAGESLALPVQCTARQFRVEVRAPSFSGISQEHAGPGAEALRGLLLAAATAAGSGHYQASAGRAVRCVPGFAPGPAAGSERLRGPTGGDGEP